MGLELARWIARVVKFSVLYLPNIIMGYYYSATSIIQTPLSMAPMLGYRVSEIVRKTEVLTFSPFSTCPGIKRHLYFKESSKRIQKTSWSVISSIFKPET